MTVLLYLPRARYIDTNLHISTFTQGGMGKSQDPSLHVHDIDYDTPGYGMIHTCACSNLHVHPLMHGNMNIVHHLANVLFQQLRFTPRSRWHEDIEWEDHMSVI